MVERTASLYVVGQWGVGNTAVGGAKGGIVGAEALSSSLARISSPNAAQLPKPSSMARTLAMTASTRAKRGAAYASNCHVTSSSSSLCSPLASAFVAKVVARSADSWQLCSLASLANALSRAEARHCSLASSASAFSCAAARRCLLASSSNAFYCTAARRCLSALSASAFSCAAAQCCSLASSANAFSRAAARHRLLASSASAFSRVAASW